MFALKNFGANITGISALIVLLVGTFVPVASAQVNSDSDDEHNQFIQEHVVCKSQKQIGCQLLSPDDKKVVTPVEKKVVGDPKKIPLTEFQRKIFQIRLMANQEIEKLEAAERKLQGAKMVNVIVLKNDYTIERVYTASKNMVADHHEADFSRVEITWTDQNKIPRGLTSNLLNKIAEMMNPETENYLILPTKAALKLNPTISKIKE
jgi:hypothetical protein